MEEDYVKYLSEGRWILSRGSPKAGPTVWTLAGFATQLEFEAFAGIRFEFPANPLAGNSAS